MVWGLRLGFRSSRRIIRVPFFLMFRVKNQNEREKKGKKGTIGVPIYLPGCGYVSRRLRVQGLRFRLYASLVCNGETKPSFGLFFDIYFFGRGG